MSHTFSWRILYGSKYSQTKHKDKDIQRHPEVDLYIVNSDS